MTCSISLGPNDDFELTLPSGRKLYIPEANGLKYLKKILHDAASEDLTSSRRGYIREYPTQHVINQWKQRDAAKSEEAYATAVADKFGFDLKELDIDL